MNIRFLNEKVKQCCSIEKYMVATVGNKCAEILKRRLLQLSAAEYLGVFAPPDSRPMRCNCIEIGKVIFFQARLVDSYKLIFKATEGRYLDWDTIKSITVHSVERRG